MKKSIKTALLTTAGAASVLAGVSAANASTIKTIKGDTVWNFAQKNHTTVDAIVKANHLSNANLIYVGQSLVIPDANDEAATQTTTAASDAPASTAPASDAAATSTASEASAATTTVDANGDYTVQAGDTLSAISAKTGVSIADLAAYSNISNQNFLLVGQTIHTTGTASAVASEAPVSQASQAPASSEATSQAPASVASQAPVSQTSQAPASQTSQAQPSAAPATSNAAPTTPTTNPSAPAAVYGNAAAAGEAGFFSGVQGYPAGQCTAFVAGILQASGVPASEWTYLGNGDAWGANAAARGVAVDHNPVAGSVAYFSYMHVAYVTSVNGNGTVNIIEGNFSGMSYHARTISASEAAGYIHF
ncbi:LysM peptidoglycan-binding domain-containing protein [Furfurilactobacillus curtus]|uniref:LysM peptidoglycan-binding domain-containing protein n=1 Tax=Furfurilactobacillus curtus TaxID=1746200 RepID=A0ABQ5JT99_9LACO